MLRVAAFTQGRNVPSSRFRVRQFIEPLLFQGVEVKEYTSLSGAYPPSNKILRLFWGILALSEQSIKVMNSYKSDITLFQRELISTFVTLEPMSKRPRILDVDDAIWLHKRGTFAERLAGKCDAVICGNTYLADNFNKWNNSIYILPTAVDTEKYKPASAKLENGKRIIGWSGSSSGFPALYAIEAALMEVLRKNSDAVLRIVSDRRPAFNILKPEQVEFIKWSPEIEVASLQEMAVGLMPLEETEWSKGKCSYKMLLYMSCGVPVIVSPVGMNKEVLSWGDVGFGVRTFDEWIDSINCILTNSAVSKKMGNCGRETAVKYYSLNVLTPRLAGILNKYA